MFSNFDIVIVGAGHAGLCMSYYLKLVNINHIVLEKGIIGETWYTQRWESFRMNTPNKFNELPGMERYFADRDGYCSARQYGDYLRQYSDTFKLPVIENCRVVSITKDTNLDLYKIEICELGEIKMFKTSKVIIASGILNEKVLPAFTIKIPKEIVQKHSSEYKNPDSLPSGAVLVVGSGQSGAQIAEDLIDSGRSVFLSSSKVGRIPRRYRSMDIVEWLINSGFYDTSIENISREKILKMRQPIVSGVGANGHTLSLQNLAKKGVKLLGSVNKVDNNWIYFDNNAKANVIYGDEFSRMIKNDIDDYISMHSIECQPRCVDIADFDDPKAKCVISIPSIDLLNECITSIIWATGVTGDFSYLNLPFLYNNGRLRHKNGISEISGLFFLGFPWLRKRKSGIIYGVKEDAEFILNEIMRN